MLNLCEGLLFAAALVRSAAGLHWATSASAFCSPPTLTQERTALHAVALWGTYTHMVNRAILANLNETQARGAAACAQLLVEAGADVNAADE